MGILTVALPFGTLPVRRSVFWIYCGCQVEDVPGCDMQQSWMRRSRVPGPLFCLFP